MDITSLIQTVKHKKLLEGLLALYKANGLIPIVGFELEFYLPSSISKPYVEENLGVVLCEEKGQGQYEISSLPTDKVLDSIEDIGSYRSALKGLGANLSPKPYLNDYGNATHWHVNVFEQHGGNLFACEDKLHSAASSMCHFMDKTIAAILATPEDYARLDHKFMAPTRICYGNNNRSVAVRIPSGVKRLEYRISSSVSDPYVSLFVILKSILIGIFQELSSHTKIFGNAFDEQYNLPELPKSLSSAMKTLDMEFFTEESKY